VHPQPIDFSPLGAVELDLSSGLSAGLGDFEGSTRDGIVVSSGSRRNDGIVERWGKWFSERDAKRTRWQVDVRVTLLDSPARAREFLAGYCAFEEWVAEGQIRSKEEGDARFCWSPIVQLRSDPEGGSLPTDQYYSIAGFQRDRLVIQMDESYFGESATAKDAVIRDLSERLQRVTEAARAR
jgi:hypothetical protein